MRILFGIIYFLLFILQISGLSDWLGLQMAGLQVIPSWALVTIVLLLLSFVTEFTSNVACTAMVLPILAEMVRQTIHNCIHYIEFYTLHKNNRIFLHSPKIFVLLDIAGLRAKVAHNFYKLFFCSFKRKTTEYAH